LITPYYVWGIINLEVVRYLSIMKSSYSTYSKSRKMGKKFNQRLRENEEVIKKVKGG
jgi:hypothetical protein